MSLGRLLDSNTARLASRLADLAQGLGLLLAVLGAAGGVAVTWLVSHGLTSGAVFAVGAATVSGAVAAGLAVHFFEARSSDDYVIEEMVGELTLAQTVLADDRFLYRYEYERRQTVRATRDNLRLVLIRSHWSGQSISVADVAPSFPEHQVLDGRIPEEDGGIYRWVYLLSALGRGRRTTVGIKHTFEDAFVPMKPYYRESGEDCRVDRLVVRLRFRAAEAPTDVWAVTWKNTRSGPGRQEVAREEFRGVKDPGSGMVVFEARIRRPRRNHAHGFVWRWPVPDSAPPCGDDPPAVYSAEPGRPGFRQAWARRSRNS